MTTIVLRYHLDENVDVAVADALLRRGIDVTIPAQAALSGAPDEEHLAFALREGRVIITHDADFLRLASQNARHAGIVYCHLGTRTIGDILRALLLLAEFYDIDDMTNQVEYR
jgi:predicted nuclease of predicted toxin-antitoxin system